MKFAMLLSTACSFSTTITGNPTRNFVKLIAMAAIGPVIKILQIMLYNALCLANRVVQMLNVSRQHIYHM